MLTNELRDLRSSEKAKEFFRYFVDLGDLKPDERVLDVGSGRGRMAIPLTGYLTSEGGYEGFDIVRERVGEGRLCQEYITPRYPNFRFQLADIFNSSYNPQGKYRAENLVFPYEDDSFDFVFLNSVFTHMLPDAVENYISEISRVLKPGGRCLITYFLLNEEPRQLIEEGASDRQFRHSRGNWAAYTTLRFQSGRSPTMRISSAAYTIDTVYIWSIQSIMALGAGEKNS